MRVLFEEVIFSDMTNMFISSFSFFFSWFCCCCCLLWQLCFVFTVTRKHENSYWIFCTCFAGNTIRSRILARLCSANCAHSTCRWPHFKYNSTLFFLLFSQLNSKSTNGKDFKNISTHVLGSIVFIILSAGKPYARCVEERTLCPKRIQV